MPDPKVPHANPTAGAGTGAPASDAPQSDLSRFVWQPGDIVIIKRGDETKKSSLDAYTKDLNS